LLFHYTANGHYLPLFESPDIPSLLRLS
jgi:hypothetical protein